MFLKRIATAAMASAVLCTGVTFAADQTVDVYAAFRAAISLSKDDDMDFSFGATFIDYLTANIGNDDFVELGTDGAVSFAGNAFSGSPTGQAGQITISGDGTSSVNISCTQTATITDGTNDLTVDQLQISMNTGDAFGAADDTCGGLGVSPLPHTLDGTDVVLLGGRIDGDSATINNDDYDSTQADGVPATIRVVYP